MASFPGNRFLGPMFNQNFPRNNFNANPVGNRFGMPPFQRPPNPAFGPFQPPERYMSGNFPNRPHFSNFPEPPGPPMFHSRLPHTNQVFPMNQAQSFPRPCTSFELPFRPWTQMPPPPLGGARPQLQNMPRPPMPPHRMGDLPLQPNKKGKLKIREFRKLKEDTTVKPFSCDTCDRAFVTENELNDHISQHIKCDRANCVFEAHPKIVAIHKKMQHDTGYADKISKLKDDAEIEKWREERRRRFPTAENVLKRKAEQAEKEERGEVLETKEFGKFKRRKESNEYSVNKDFRRRRSKRYKKSADRRREFHPRSQSFTVNLDSDSDSDSDSHIKLNRFLGMSLANSAKEITDKDEAVEVSSTPHMQINLVSDKQQFTPEQNLPKFKLKHNISHPNLLCADSNSSNLDKNQTTFVLNDDSFNDTSSNCAFRVPVDESAVVKQNFGKDLANESILEIPVDESVLNEQKNVELVEIKDSDDEAPVVVPIVKSLENCIDEEDKNSDDEAPVIVPIVKSIENCIDEEDKSSKGSLQRSHYSHANSQDVCLQRRHYRHANGQDASQEVRKSSLLEKLLADDIRHERNVILQCIRHIVKSNFFGIENKHLK